MIRAILKFSLILLLIFLVIACITNPDKEAFKLMVEDQIKRELPEISGSPLIGIATGEAVQYASQWIEKFVVRKNYYVCSVYTVRLPQANYSYLGAFTTFLPLQDENPVDAIKQEFQ
ncbi:MAG: DUF4359 domain-containing protein [Flavobacteriales bacterium]|nr:DUF4359 domain-containing protein [Flavobacteriales bacterium]